MITLAKIRLIASIALLCAICLPLSRCSKNENPHEEAIVGGIIHKIFPQDNTQYSYNYGYKKLGFTYDGIVTLLTFTWPILFLYVGTLFHKFRDSEIKYIIELILCCGSLFWIYMISNPGEPLYGLFVSLSSIFIIGCSSMTSMVEMQKKIQK